MYICCSQSVKLVIMHNAKKIVISQSILYKYLTSEIILNDFKETSSVENNYKIYTTDTTRDIRMHIPLDRIIPTMF